PVQPEGPPIAWLEFSATPGRVAVRKKHVTIGREADNDIVTDANEDTVSRHHAVISINNNGRFQITNRSTEYRHTPNPIFINDKEM
ncbi:FHA domain-containing protein, partial [Klebsiella pneumoniae]|uniref:FHA domain-containing protein n=1 Tax=Klebsiella pneumoniae TaxID=573 RepID=UPI0013D77D95